MKALLDLQLLPHLKVGDSDDPEVREYRIRRKNEVYCTRTVYWSYIDLAF